MGVCRYGDADHIDGADNERVLCHLQFVPAASTTTPAPPADNSFIGGVLQQLANNDGSSGGAGQALLDAVVKQASSVVSSR